MRLPVVFCSIMLFTVCTSATRSRAGESTGRSEADVVTEARERTTGKPEGRRDDAQTLVVSLFTGTQYDDNITLRSMGVDIKDDDRTDWKLIHALELDLRAINSEGLVAGMRYRFYQSFIEINNDLQLTGHTIGSYVTGIKAPYVFHLPAEISHYNLYWHDYLDICSISPQIYFEQTEHAVGVLKGGWMYSNYHQIAGNDFDENERDARTWTIGGEEWFLLGKDAQYRLEFEYLFRREYADEHQWSYFSHKLRAGLGFGLPIWGISTGAAVTYEAVDYDQENPLFAQTQEDDIMTYGLTFSRAFGRYTSASLSYLFTDNESNVTSQEFERHQVTLGVNIQF